MKKMIGRILFGAVVMLATAVTAANAQSGSSSAPENKGNTGWSGGSQDQPSQGDRGGEGKSSGTTGQNTPDSITKAVEGSHDADSAKTQPEMATGEDLKGPPKQFPAAKTPE